MSSPAPPRLFFFRKQSPIKNIRNIIRIVVSFLLGGYLLLLFGLNLPFVQRQLAAGAAGALSGMLGAEVHVGKVEVGLFNRLTLSDVLLNDLQRKPLLEARQLSARIELRPLMRGEVSLRMVSLLDARVRLYKESENVAPNFQFLLDAFKGKDDGQPSRLNLRVNSFILRRCALRYDRLDAFTTPSRFNASHINVERLDANLSLKRLTPDSLNLRVRSFSFREQSGVAVDRLSLALEANSRGMHVSHFELAMPHGTYLAKEELHATYDGSAGAARLWQTLAVTGRLSQACVATDDLVPFIPRLQGLQRRGYVMSGFRITPADIALPDLIVYDDRQTLSLVAGISMHRRDGRVVSGRAVVRRVFVGNELSAALFARLTRKDVPAALQAVGDVTFKGEAGYVRDGRSSLQGTCTTDVGQLQLQVRQEGHGWEARVSSADLQPARLMASAVYPETVDFSLDARADFSGTTPDIGGKLRLNAVSFPAYTYRDIEVRGQWARNALTATVTADDEACRLTAEFCSHFDGKRFSALALNADVRDFAPAAMGLTRKFEHTRFSSRVEAALAGFDFRHPQVRLRLEDFTMRSPDAEHQLHDLNLSVLPSPRGTRIRLDSDFATAEADGPFSVAALRDCALEIAGECLPGLVERKPRNGHADEWRFTVRLRDTELLQALTGVPLDLFGPFALDGNIHSAGGRTSVVASCDGLRYDGTEVRDIRLYLQGAAGRYSLLAQGEKKISRSDVKFVLESRSDSGALRTTLDWDDVGTHKYKGALHTRTECVGEQGQRGLKVSMLPTTVAINDSLWRVGSGELVWDDHSLSIRDFSLTHASQALLLDGRLSKEGGDSIVADLRDLEIAYILDLVNFDDVAFSGHATGRVRFYSTAEAPDVVARLRVPDFLFNGSPMGNADIRGRWNGKEKRIELDAAMEEPGLSRTTVKGYVAPPQKRLDLLIGSRGTHIGFLRRYVADIFGDLDGRVTGQCRLFGPFKQLDFEGKETGQVSAEILSTGVRYNLDGGSIDISPGTFAFNNMRLTDRDGGRGTVTGALTHRHLKDLRYAFRIGAENLLVYDKPKEMDMPFYATVYGTGSVDLNGCPGSLGADIRLRPERNTQFVYTIDSPDTFGDTQLLTFGSASARPDSVAADSTVVPAVPESTTDIRLNFLVDMNPAATLKIVMDEKAGDNIVVHGEGPIRASFYNKGSFNMFGTYTVADGVYKLSIQDVIRKDFELERGGRIVFSGDPYDGDLDLSASHIVNSASLSDLNIGTSLSESSVRVKCILNFSGKVHSPVVGFDLDLPTVNEDEKQMVRNLISTEEEMNMQILYLLGVGRFYTYNYGSTEGAATQSQSSVAVKSFLSNTLSSQLNDIISNAIGSSNWTFGANLSTGNMGWSDMEVEGLLSGRLLNNRLLINGNFGYKEHSVYNSTNFVGDFDLSYLLTPGGGVNLKAYSETNDRYFTKSSLSTQGVGIMLKRDFSNLKDLFTPNRKRRRTPAAVPAADK